MSCSDLDISIWTILIFKIYLSLILYIKDLPDLTLFYSWILCRLECVKQFVHLKQTEWTFTYFGIPQKRGFHSIFNSIFRFHLQHLNVLIWFLVGSTRQQYCIFALVHACLLNVEPSFTPKPEHKIINLGFYLFRSCLWIAHNTT